MVHQEENAALLALRGGLRGRFRRSFDCMENAFEVLQDRLDHTATPAERAELTPLLEELQTQAALPAPPGRPGIGRGHGGIAAWHL